MLDPLVNQLIAISLGLLFLTASVHKLSGFATFSRQLREYRLLPESLVVPASAGIVIAELALGAGWLFWSGNFIVAAASVVLLGSYALAIAINIRRGRIHIDCGCTLGSENSPPLSSGLVIRNLVLIGAALVAALPTRPRELAVGDYTTLGAGILVLLLLYAATNQLLANHAAMGTWRSRDE